MSLKNKCSVNSGVSDPIQLSDILSMLKNDLSDKLEFPEKLTDKSLSAIIDVTGRVLHFCHIKYFQLLKPQLKPGYEDLLAANLSMYWDLVLMQIKEHTIEDQKNRVKQLCTQTGCLLAHDPMYKLDVLLQQTQASELIHIPHVKKLVKRMVGSVTPDGPLSYTKFILTSRLFRCLDDVVQRALGIAAPKNYLQWLQGQNADILDNIPETPKFKGTKISQFLLNEAGDTLVEQLLDLLTDFSCEKKSEVCSDGTISCEKSKDDCDNLFLIDTVGSKQRDVNIKDDEEESCLLETSSHDPLFDEVPDAVKEKINDPGMFITTTEVDNDAQIESNGYPNDDNNEEVHGEDADAEGQLEDQDNDSPNIEQTLTETASKYRHVSEKTLLKPAKDEIPCDVYDSDFTSDIEEPKVTTVKRLMSKRIAELRTEEDSGKPVKPKRRASAGLSDYAEPANFETAKSRRRSMPLKSDVSDLPSTRSRKRTSSQSSNASMESITVKRPNEDENQSTTETPPRKSSRKTSVPAKLRESAVQEVPAASKAKNSSPMKASQRKRFKITNEQKEILGDGSKDVMSVDGEIDDGLLHLPGTPTRRSKRTRRISDVSACSNDSSLSTRSSRRQSMPVSVLDTSVDSKPKSKTQGVNISQATRSPARSTRQRKSLAPYPSH